MLNSPKKIYLDGTVVHKKKTRAGISPGNNGIDLGNWIEKSIQAGSINVGSSVNSLDDLTDVTLGSPSNGDVLTYNSSTQKFISSPVAASVTELDDLSDVGLVNALANGDILVYDSSTQKFINLPTNTYVKANITEGTLNTPTNDRTVNMGPHRLVFTGSNYQKFYVSNQTDVYTEIIADTFAARVTYYNDSGSNHILNTCFASAAGAGAITNEGKVYVDNLGAVLISSNSKVYKLGENSALVPDYYNTISNSPQTLILNTADNQIFRVDTSFQFLSNTQISPATLFHPTKTEVETFLFSLPTSTKAGNLNRYFYYNGTDDPAVNYTYVYYLTGDNKIIEIYKPEEHWFSTAIGLAGDVITADAVSPLAQIGNLYSFDRTVDSFTVTWNANNSTGNISLGIIDNNGWQFTSLNTTVDTLNYPFYSVQVGGEYVLDSTDLQHLRRQAYGLKLSNFSAGAYIESPKLSFRVRKNS